ncbi:3-oxoacyl-[acyl-carrier protein] reductase [Catenulispora sp. GP43]|uniref:SDR family oxidoreductase n=1 Tax=Catenulispora sp. GP43 TaxID=3156263 RepID=UPI00351421F0
MTTDTTGNTPRVAIITGASRGIGAAVAHHLAADGHTVVLGYAGRADLAEQAVTAITAAGGHAIAAQADVADEHAVTAMFDTAEQQFGGIDTVINAAGQMKLSTVADLDLTDLDTMHRTNIRGAFVIAQQAAKRLRPGGSLILFSTSVMGTKFPTYAGYTASKGAVEAMTLILARELRGRDVTVNTVAPGPTATDMFLDGKDDELIAHLAAQNPLERLGQPDDIARLVTFLAGPQGHWVNGQVIRANGGMV